MAKSHLSCGSCDKKLNDTSQALAHLLQKQDAHTFAYLQARRPGTKLASSCG